MGTYSISDLSELTGVKTHTLRVWEKRYGFLRPQRTDTNIRYYAESDLQLLRLVQRLNNNGIRISRIAEMTLEEMQAACNRITIEGNEYEEKMEQGLRDMDVTSLESVLDTAIRHHGFETALVRIIMPFLEKMELMWLSGKIEESNEALFKELIRRKAIRELDMLPHNCSGPRVIMLLPVGNRQELMHLFTHYFLRKQGLCVTDIGSNIEMDCAVSAIKKCAASCVLIVNADPVHWQFSQYVGSLEKQTELPVIISGKAIEMTDTDAARIIMLDTIDDTIQFTSRLQENLKNQLS